MPPSSPRRRHLSADRESTCGPVSLAVLGFASAGGLYPPTNGMPRTALRPAADAERSRDSHQGLAQDGDVTTL